MPGKRDRLLARLARWWFRRRLFEALALNRKKEVRPDGLGLKMFHNKLQVEWRARKVHPWDKDTGLSRRQLSQRFVRQCLDDTSNAIEQLFLRLPEVESIDFKVIDPESSAPILCGLVRREEVERVGEMPAGMKLRTLGATYRLNNSTFEPLT